MSNDLNLCQFIGRLGKDPVPRYLPNGTATVQISIAVGEQWKDKASGEKKERTTWVPVVAFGRLAEIMAEYLKTGSRIYVAGKFSVRQWEKDGQKHYATEIVARELQLLDKRDDSRPSADPAQSRAYREASGGSARQPVDFDAFPDDDIPF